MKKTIIKAKNGLHARPASRIVSIANEFKSEISLKKNGIEYNCKSIMAIMGSGLSFGDEIEINAIGEDGEEAEITIYEVIESIEE